MCVPPWLYRCEPRTVYVVPDRVIVPVDVFPSPQLMMALNAPVDSTPPAWVKVATTMLLWDLPDTVIVLTEGGED